MKHEKEGEAAGRGEELIFMEKRERACNVLKTLRPKTLRRYDYDHDHEMK